MKIMDSWQEIGYLPGVSDFMVEMDIMKLHKNKQYLKIGLVLLALTGILQISARNIAGFSTWYARHLYPMIVGTIGRFFGIFSFSVVEIMLYLLIFVFVVYVVRFWRQPWRLLSRMVFLSGVLLLTYTCNCGINYYAVPFSQYAGLKTEPRKKEDLLKLCEYLIEMVNETATAESYGGAGFSPGSRGNRQAWREEAVSAMAGTASSYPVLAGYYPKPKQVAFSDILSIQQLCGIYSPFTVEANFNGAMPDYNIPHTLCHELSHLKGFMREDEANFIGYLACIGSERQVFRYSGYLTGWVYAGNALAGVDGEAYRALHQRLCGQAKSDLQGNNVFWDQYEGKVAEAANQVNDVYLKMNDQSDGVQSYGRMVDLMLEYYCQEGFANER